MPKSGRRILATIILLLAVFPGCRNDAPRSQQGLRFIDDLDRVVELPAAAQRIVTLAPNITEIAFVAGAGSRIVGVSTADDYPDDVIRIPKVSALPVDFEAVAALEPDLVLATSQINDPRSADSFRAIGIPSYFFDFDTVDDVLDAVRVVGRMAGRVDRASAAADSLGRVLDELRTRPRDSVAVLVLIGDEQLFSFGAGSYIHELVSIAGGRSVTRDIANRNPVLSEEYILRANPDVIVGAFGPGYETAAMVANHPSFTSLRAVRRGHVYGVDPDFLLRPGPRLVDGAREISRILSEIKKTES